MSQKKKNDTSKELTPGLVEKSLRIENAELAKQCAALSLTIDKAVKTLQEKDEEIAHLKMLLRNVPTITDSSSGLVEVLAISEEEEIAQLQLEFLKKKARAGELTLEEVKKFDLLVKNKNLSKTPQEKEGALPKNMGKSRLIAIANSRKDSDDQ